MSTYVCNEITFEYIFTRRRLDEFCPLQQQQQLNFGGKNWAGGEMTSLAGHISPIFSLSVQCKWATVHRLWSHCFQECQMLATLSTSRRGLDFNPPGQEEKAATKGENGNLKPQLGKKTDGSGQTKRGTKKPSKFFPLFSSLPDLSN